MTGLVVVAVCCAATVLACAAEPQQAIIVPVPTPTSTSPAVSKAEGLLPSGCDAVSTSQEVKAAIGRDVGGAPRSVPGAADSKIGRTARLDCYYGLADGRPVSDALVAIGLATYTDDQAAARRVASTVDGERGSGVQVSSVKVGEDQGTLLTGTTLTLVVAHRSTTVVVTVPKNVVPPDQVSATLARIATRALSPQ